MSTPKSTHKSEKSIKWNECDNCGTIITVGDNEKHLTNCPPNPENVTHFYINNQCLIGDLNVKKNEEIGGPRSDNLEHMVFLSISCMQLLGLAISDLTVLRMNNLAPIIKRAWPTAEKNLTSVHLTKKVLDLYFGDVKAYPNVSVEKLMGKTKEAKQIIVKSIGSPKTTEISEIIGKRLCNMFKGTIFTPGNKISIFHSGRVLKFSIKEVISENTDVVTELGNSKFSDNLHEVTQETKWILLTDKDKIVNKISPSISEIGGLSEKIEEIKLLMNHSFAIGSNEERLTAVLLYGRPGTGKTMLAKAIASESKFNFQFVDRYLYYTRSEETLQKIFENAVSNGPTVIILDEVDVMFPQSSSKASDTEHRFVEKLLTLLDELHYNEKAKVFIIGTTNNIDNIDIRFRRPDRFEREIEIPLPNPIAKKNILEKILSKFKHSISEDQFLEISTSTHGFVGLDLKALCRQAKSRAIENSREILDITDLKFALENVVPFPMKKYQVKVENVKWSDIGGQEEVKLFFKRIVERLKDPFKFSRFGTKPLKSVLMHGPPGCSKTMIAKALATESGLNFFLVKGPELFNKWVGESERNVRELFQTAKQMAPSIIFFDEIDATGSERASGSSKGVQDQVLTQLLTELDGAVALGDVIVIAATNRLDRLDKALLRPKRFDKIVHVPLPNHKTRMEILRLELVKMAVQDVDIKRLADSTENYSGADIYALCAEAADIAEEEDISAITMKQFQMALEIRAPTRPKSMLYEYSSKSSFKIAVCVVAICVFGIGSYKFKINNIN